MNAYNINQYHIINHIMMNLPDHPSWLALMYVYMQLYVDKNKLSAPTQWSTHIDIPIWWVPAAGCDGLRWTLSAFHPTCEPLLWLK